MSECILSKPDDYETFCDFFTRRLKKGVHKIDGKKDSIVSSCDGKILGTNVSQGAVVSSGDTILLIVSSTTED